MPSDALVLWWVRLLLLGALTVVLGDATLDKLRGWRGVAAFTREHFAKTPLRAVAVPLLVVLSVLMGLSTLGCAAGIVQLALGVPPSFGFPGALLGALAFLALLFGQQVGGNHAGANAILPLLILAVLAVWSFAGG